MEVVIYIVNSDHLPLAAVVRSVPHATSAAIRTVTIESSLAARSGVDGFPLSAKALKGTAKFYRATES